MPPLSLLPSFLPLFCHSCLRLAWHPSSLSLCRDKIQSFPPCHCEALAVAIQSYLALLFTGSLRLRCRYAETSHVHPRDDKVFSAMSSPQRHVLSRLAKACFVIPAKAGIGSMKFTEFELAHCSFLVRVANTVWTHSCLRRSDKRKRRSYKGFLFLPPPAMTRVFPYMYKKFIGIVFVCCYYAIA